jgi:hypothetical protein
VTSAPHRSTARRTLIGAVAIVLTAGIGLAACGDDDEGDENNESPTQSTEMMDDTPTTEMMDDTPTTEMMDDTPTTEMMDDTTP